MRSGAVLCQRPLALQIRSALLDIAPQSTVINPAHGGDGLLNKSLRWSERSRQRADLRDLDEHLLEDIGITRQQALDEANRPFWE
jgi:uncharacterized protein YjiS (DUF1127 family)